MDGAFPSELLVGALGVRIVNMILTPAMFARLAVVSSGVLSTARSLYAWENLAVHLRRLRVHPRALFRMLGMWQLSDYISIGYREARVIDSHFESRRYWIAAVWKFPEVGNTLLEPSSDDEEGDVISARLNENPCYMHAASEALPSRARVNFNVTYWGRMPEFDVGWKRHGGEFVFFRIVHERARLRPEDDRARWYRDTAMSDDAAIRLPRSRTRSPSDDKVCLKIGLMRTENAMILFVEEDRWCFDVEPRFIREWSQSSTRRVALEMYNPDGMRRHPIITPLPVWLPPRQK